ncbi:MAG: dihydropteroate synthase [Bacteriovoracaceae bacterium]|nr:dihydropteroate synthase [Bacteriovoracaceae bacterium]
MINITPNSFSGLGEILSPAEVAERFNQFGQIEALDLGAESTAPMNKSIGHEEEWERLAPYLPYLKTLKVPLSLDTYHPETISKIASLWLKEGIEVPLIWNDVSGKFDHFVEEFLSFSPKFSYVFCHNLAPTRELSGRHMDYVSPLQGEDYLEELAAYFLPFKRERVILDPTLGFSKTHEQNWLVLENFGKLQQKVRHDQWLLGFSRKSFLRRKLGFEKITSENREELDQYHQKILEEIKPQMTGTVLIRTHRPELIQK